MECDISLKKIVLAIGFGTEFVEIKVYCTMQYHDKLTKKQTIMTKAELNARINANNEQKIETIKQAKLNLQDAIKFYVMQTNLLGIEFSEQPSMQWYIDDEDNNDCYIKHLSFTDKGELADVTLLSCYTDEEVVIDADDFWGSGADYDDIAAEILYETK